MSSLRAAMRRGRRKENGGIPLEPPPPPPLWPTLGATLGRYLGALRALLGPRQWARSRRIVRAFGAPGGVGARLHQRLQRGAAPSGAWPRAPGGRLPLPVHGSAGLVLPTQKWEGTGGQLQFAAQLVAGILHYRAEAEQRDPPEPWVRAVFGGCRVPGPQRDGVLRVAPGADPPDFITVIRNGEFFQVQACTEAGSPLPPAALGAALGQLRSLGGRGGGPAVGALTGEHRRGWGRVYGMLMRDRLNRASIGRIQRSLLALALDAPVMAAAVGQEPGGGAELVLHGGGAGANSCNRWFDKALQVIVGADGSCGLLYDPEVLDGAVAAEMADHALSFCRSSAPGPAPIGFVPRPQRLRFSVGPEMGPEVQRARRHLDSLAADVELHCFSHEGFGPGGANREEALLHVALQVAFYRLHGSVSACAEAPPLRPRPLPHPTLVLPPGPRCRTLAKAMEEPNIEPEVLRALLWEAVEAQQQRMEEVAAGQGAERHLRALGLTAVAGGEPLPELFRDLGYAKATHFRLCTLQVRSARGCLPIRGPLVPDGYGIGVGHALPTSGHAHPTSGHAHPTSGHAHSTSGPTNPTSCLMEPTSCLEDPFFNPSEFTSGLSHSTSCPKEPISGHETSPDPSQPTSGHAEPTSGHETSTSGHEELTSGHEEHTSGHAEATSGHETPTSGHAEATSCHEDPTSGHEDPTSGHAGSTSGHAPLRVAVSAFASCGGTGAERLGAELRAALDQLGALIKGQRPPAAGG